MHGPPSEARLLDELSSGRIPTGWADHDARSRVGTRMGRRLKVEVLGAGRRTQRLSLGGVKVGSGKPGWAVDGIEARSCLGGYRNRNRASRIRGWSKEDGRFTSLAGDAGVLHLLGLAATMSCDVGVDGEAGLLFLLLRRLLDSNVGFKWASSRRGLSGDGRCPRYGGLGGRLFPRQIFPWHVVGWGRKGRRGMVFHCGLWLL
jgi:hypothetical protein